MPALLCSPTTHPSNLLLKFYCVVSLNNPHSKCISPEFITRRHLPPDPAYHFAAVYGGEKIKSIWEGTLWPFEKKAPLYGFPGCIINLGPPPSSSRAEHQCVWQLAFVKGWTVVLTSNIHCPWDRGILFLYSVNEWLRQWTILLFSLLRCDQMVCLRQHEWSAGRKKTDYILATALGEIRRFEVTRFKQNTITAWEHCVIAELFCCCFFLRCSCSFCTLTEPET